MNTAIEDDSTLTDRYQTTVPASVRRALKLKRRDRIHYTVRPNGEVVLSRASDEPSQDPVMASFLAFLERDLQAHPENIRPVAAGTFAEAERLTSGIEVDLGEALPEDDDDV
ncbi:type II toxin-antitoxin system PrlF family antitoxin [Chromohalobacter sp. TMW 2.2308]|uniref:type II toxin-antitoxin system PrlF family antitoxin n=1 Tax=Chromohalobacter TaxID=42054 RepID=UPI001FFC890B|nr:MULTISPECIES: type II toxin-antitoxin system PrlF family antitoxin [Chromohalobacter]MCK2043976.1 type II toxin-antitoxin system PrlF family antitoxin [Chromohalobacter moromii]MCT8515899.1 type II toxin-antitoxin system PrlF family antitoxin [Chromohalobacter sp. TMW 2.2271]